MPSYLTDAGMWAGLWPVLLLPVLTGGLCYLAAAGSRDTRAIALSSIAFGLLGSVIGYLTGLSREPVVGVVVPAFLTLIGGLALFEAGRKKEQQHHIAIIVGVLCVNLLIATAWGSHDRIVAALEMQRFVENDRERQLTRASFTQKQVNEFRENLGLPALELADVIQREDAGEEKSKKKK